MSDLCELNQRERNIALAWLIAGEGSIGLHRIEHKSGRQIGKVSFRPIIQISNTDLPMLQNVKRAFGGGIYENTCIRFEHQKPIYNWVVSKQAFVLVILEAIEPFLPMKNEQCKLLIEYCNSRLNREHHKDRYQDREYSIWKELRYLNQKKGGTQS